MKFPPFEDTGSVDPLDPSGVPPVAPKEKNTTFYVVVAVMVMAALATVAHYMSAASVVG